MQDICRNRSRSNPESKAAFNMVEPHIAAQEAQILAALDMHRPGLITEQLEDLLKLPRSSASARVSELKRRGLVACKQIGTTEDGKPIYERRRTRSGASAAVVVLVRGDRKSAAL